ncbi:MAG: universal stress protein [Rubrivivax sp.]|jgi:nucleotide-binding universal stress UspA family protein|nr:universal stress protein [Rubrivivax sp.]
MYRNLFVPLDGGPLTDKAMTESLKLARQLGAGVVGFVAEPEAPLPSVNTRLDEYYDKVERHTVVTDTHARLLLTRFELLAAEAQVPFKALHVTSDRIEESIVEEAERSEADMIVMVTHGRSTVGEWIYGSHTKKVLSLSRLPLLVLH